MHKKKILRNGLILLHIVFALVGFIVYISNYQLSEQLLIQDTLNKQLLLAKAGSSSVQNLFNNTQNELSSFVFTFAKINETSSIDKEETRKNFIQYMQRAPLPVNGIALYDETGKLSIIENRYDIRIGEGQDFSKTAFIQWSKNPLNREKVFISSPYIGTTGASVGKIIFIIAKPVYFGDAYKGTLALRLLVNDFGKAYVTPLTSGTDELSFVVSKTGILLAGNNTLLNKNLFLYAQTHHWRNYKDFINILHSALQVTTMQSLWTFQYPGQTAQKFIVGISKIDIPNTDNDLYMIVATPQNKALSPLSPVRGYGLVWLGFGLFVSIAGSIIILLLQSF
jgi:hypothetical protein